MDRGNNSGYRENIVAFVVVRLSSSRLPKKQLRNIGNKRLIDWTLESLKKSKFIDKIVITSTADSVNAQLVEVAKEHDVEVFFYQGDENDVVGRLTYAAKLFDANIPVLISGDCPLICIHTIDKMIQKILEEPHLDTVGICHKDGKTCILEGIGVYRKRCWELAEKISDKPNLREFFFPVIYLKPDLFKTDCIYADDLYYKINHRISVDTLADLEFMNSCFNELKKINLDFSIKNVINLILRRPDLLKINEDVHQIKIDEKQKKALFFVKIKENLDIYFKIAYDITKMGIGVRFYSEDAYIKKKIEEQGFGITEKIINCDIIIEDCYND